MVARAQERLIGRIEIAVSAFARDLGLWHEGLVAELVDPPAPQDAPLVPWLRGRRGRGRDLTTCLALASLAGIWRAHARHAGPGPEAEAAARRAMIARGAADLLARTIWHDAPQGPLAVAEQAQMAEAVTLEALSTPHSKASTEPDHPGAFAPPSAIAAMLDPAGPPAAPA